jgi:hypothetical protein
MWREGACAIHAAVIIQPQGTPRVTPAPILPAQPPSAAGAQGRRRRAAPAPPGAAPLPALDPPPRLAGVSVVLVEPLRPRTVGTVARVCACFEALDLHLVQPRCDHLSRRAYAPHALLAPHGRPAASAAYVEEHVRSTLTVLATGTGRF